MIKLTDKYIKFIKVTKFITNENIELMKNKNNEFEIIINDKLNIIDFFIKIYPSEKLIHLSNLDKNESKKLSCLIKKKIIILEYDSYQCVKDSYVINLNVCVNRFNNKYDDDNYNNLLFHLIFNNIIIFPIAPSEINYKNSFNISNINYLSVSSLLNLSVKKYFNINSIEENAYNFFNNSDIIPDEIFMVYDINCNKILKTKLYDHQKEGLLWLLYREKLISLNDNLKQNDIHPYYYVSKYNVKTSEIKLYFNSLTNELTLDKPLNIDIIKGGILADDMGLGKTLMLISLIGISREYFNKNEKTLIVLPNMLIEQWVNEFQKHLINNLSIYIIQNTKDNIDNLQNYDVVIITHNLLRLIYENNIKHTIFNYKWNRMIIDEAHNAKSNKTKLFNVLNSVNSDSIWCVTGTPIQNKLTELFSYIKILKYKPWDNDDWWNKKLLKYDNNSKIINYIMKPVMLRRTKDNIKLYNNDAVINKIIEINYIELCKNDEEIYKSVMNNSKISNTFHFGNKFNYMQIFQFITKLRLFCNSKKFVESFDIYDIYNDVYDCDNSYEYQSNKVTNIVNKTIKILNNTKDKIIIFSQYVKMIKVLETVFNKNMIKNVNINGEIDKETRLKLINTFDNDDSYRVMLISLKVGGCGLNLVSANHVILAEPSWNPSIENQAIDRLFRIGQLKDTFVYKFITKNSIEEKIMKLQIDKTKLVDVILSNQEAPVIDDIKYLLC